MKRKAYLKLVKEERKRQEEIYGNRQHWDAEWFILLSEEVGEVAKAIILDDIPQMRKELIQCAALIESWFKNPCPPVEDD